MIRDNYIISECTREDVITFLRKYFPEDEYNIETKSTSEWVYLSRKDIPFVCVEFPNKNTSQNFWTGYKSSSSSSSWSDLESVSSVSKIYININEKTKCVFFEAEKADGTFYYNATFLKDCIASKSYIYYNYGAYFSLGNIKSDKVISLAPFINHMSILDTIEKDENVYYLTVGPSLSSSTTFNLNGHKYKTINNYLVYKIE